MSKDGETHKVVAPPPGGGWAEYIEAQLDTRERTERLRALRLQQQGDDRDSDDGPDGAGD